MPKPSIEPLDFSDLQTYSVYGRHSKVTIEDFARPLSAGMRVSELLAALPAQLAGVDFPEFVRSVAKSIKK